MNDDLRIDEAETFRHGRDFMTSDLTIEGGELTIDVGDANLVEIDECDDPDAAAGESLGGPRTYSADADDRDVRLSQSREGRRAIKTGDSGKAVKIIGWQGFVQSNAPCVVGRIVASCGDEKYFPMKWQVLAIGKPSLRYARSGVEEYQKRLTRYTTLDLQSDWKDLGQSKNSETLLAASEGAVRIVLDERGDPWTTEDLVTRVEGWQMHGVKRVAILIGGADGHSKELRQKADHLVALSGFTLQHELALVVLLEQIYRVHTILRGEPYHR